MASEKPDIEWGPIKLASEKPDIEWRPIKWNKSLSPFQFEMRQYRNELKEVHSEMLNRILEKPENNQEDKKNKVKFKFILGET